MAKIVGMGRIRLKLKEFPNLKDTTQANKNTAPQRIFLIIGRLNPSQKQIKLNRQ